MVNEIINLRVKEAEDRSGMGTLYLSKKIGKDSYVCLAVAILNADCCGQLKDMQGEYSKGKQKHE